MKEIEYKLDVLEGMLKEDGYNGSNIVMQTLNELRAQLKNCNLQSVIDTVCDHTAHEKIDGKWFCKCGIRVPPPI